MTFLVPLEQLTNQTAHPHVTRIVVRAFVPDHSYLINRCIGDIPDTDVLTQLQFTDKHFRDDGNQICLTGNVWHGAEVS